MIFQIFMRCIVLGMQIMYTDMMSDIIHAGPTGIVILNMVMEL